MPNFSLNDSVFVAAADKFPTPFHLYDEAGLRQNARNLQARLQGRLLRLRTDRMPVGMPREKLG